MDYPKYIVNKYCDNVYCGNGFFDTIEECMQFAEDGFCDKALIANTETEEVTKVTLKTEF